MFTAARLMGLSKWTLLSWVRAGLVLPVSTGVSKSKRYKFDRMAFLQALLVRELRRYSVPFEAIREVIKRVDTASGKHAGPYVVIRPKERKAVVVEDPARLAQVVTRYPDAHVVVDVADLAQQVEAFLNARSPKGEDRKEVENDVLRMRNRSGPCRAHTERRLGASRRRIYTILGAPVKCAP